MSNKEILADAYYSCIGKGGLYVVVDSPAPAGVSKSYDPIVVYMDLRTAATYWRFRGDFLDRMEVVSGENTEEAIRSKTRH